MLPYAVFIYTKDGKIKALTLDQANSQHNDLIADGYTHTMSIDACLWIEYLHNDCKKKIKEIKWLSEIKGK